MKVAHLGDLTVGRIGFGALGVSDAYTGAGTDEAEAVATLHRAIDLGATLIDTAEIYGPYTNEEFLGAALGSRRDEVVLATRFGAIDHATGELNRLDSRRANIRRAVEGSLSRLRTDRIDLYYQHRVDPGTPIEDVMGTLAELVSEGKIRYAGLCEAGPATIQRAHAVHPVTAVQSEYSLWTRDPEAEVLPLLTELNIGFVPYSPLGRGFLTGTVRSTAELNANDLRRTIPRFDASNLEVNLRIVDEITAIAGEVGATSAQVALAWLVSRGKNVVPIPGTKRVSRVEENLAADAVALSAEQIAVLERLTPAAGDHHNEAQMRLLGR